MIRDFDQIPISREQKPRVGIVGEILVKFLPAANNYLAELLEKEGLLNEKPQGLGSNRYQFYVSDMADKFQTFANSILKYGILSAKTINIESY